MNFFIRILADGCKQAIQLLASMVTFDNTPTTLTSTNVQDALVEIATLTGAAYQFSIHTAKTGETIVIPECQQMVLCEDGFCVEDDGGFCIEGDGSIALI